MKLAAGFGGNIVLFLLVTLIVSPVLTAYAGVEPAQVLIQAVKGPARYSAGDSWQPLKRGMVLTNGAVIQTETDATVDLLLQSSRTALRLMPNSTLRVDKLNKEPAGELVVTDTSLTLLAGSLIGSQRKLAAPSQFNINTAHGVARIVGTEYMVRADGAVSCLSGSVDVHFNPAGRGKPIHITVAAGFSFDPATGQVVPTSAAFLQDIIAHIDTVRQNAEVFKLGGVTVVVRPIEVVSPTQVQSANRANGANPGGGGRQE